MKEKEITLGAAVIAGPDRLDELKRLLPQLSKLDQVVVVNTSKQGSISNYVRRLKKPFEVYEDPFRPSSVDENGKEYGINDWGFARARNISLQKLTTDYGFWIDTDDFLGIRSPFDGKDRSINAQAVRDGFLKIIKERSDVDVWFADYHYSYDDNGNPNVVHARERLFKNPSSWKVVYPIHECFVPDHAVVHNVIRDIKFIHVPTVKPETSSERNMRMLQEWLKQLEREQNAYHDLARCRLQIGETYWGQHEYRKAANWLEKEYLAKHPDAIDLEKWQACSFAAKSYIQIGNLSKASEMALLAIQFEPRLPDGYYLLAECKYLGEESPHDILQLIDYAARCDDPPPQVIRNPLDYTYTPNCIISAMKYQLGEYEIALDFALKALRDAPNSPQAEKLRVQAAEKLRIQDGSKAAVALYQLLRDYDEHEKAAKLIADLPYEIQSDPEVLAVYEGAKQRAAAIMPSTEGDDKYLEYFSDPPYWEPTDWGWFEKGYIPGIDRYNYLLSRIKGKPEIKKILIVGCDDGFHAIKLAQEGYEVTGIDLNKQAIRIANERAEKLGVSAKFMEGWFERLNPDEVKDLFNSEISWEGHFDVVIASEQIDRVKDVGMFLEGMGTCLRPKGKILLTTPNGAWDAGDIPYNRKEGELPYSVRVFTQETFESLVNSHKEYTVTECHFIPYSSPRREGQGWLVAEILKARRVIGPRIRIFCGDKVESFSPLNLMTGGIGGSETAVIHMADSWTKMGCVVTVYRADPSTPNNIGIYDGVSYRHAEAWNHNLESDIFISWRLPHIFNKGRPKAKKVVLWCHDISFPIEVKPEWIEHVDVIAVLSNWHKEFIMKVHSAFPEEKMWITRNGIDPARFRQTVEKQKHHYFFSSSYDRGLEELIQIWPKVKKEIPDAVLHVGYGTYTAAELMKERRQYKELDELRGMEQTMYEMDGVVYHQRMNQWELAKIQLECEAWLYPYQHGDKWAMVGGGFPETYCITALEAQAAGAIPISRSNAALSETIQNRIPWEKEDTDKTILKKLKNPEKFITKEQIEENQSWAMSQSWYSLAGEWLEKLFTKEEVDD